MLEEVLVVSRKVLTERSTLYSGARGSCVVTILAPGHVLLTLYGYNDGEVASHYYAAMEAEMHSAGFLVLFMDSREQSGISPEERERASEWTKKWQGKKYRSGHLLFKSRLLEMALAVVRLMTGHVLIGYSRTEEFEEVIARAVPGFSRLPSFKHHLGARPAERAAVRS